MSQYQTIGFIGLGVMGGPICRNLVKKSGAAVVVFDLSQQVLAQLRAEGAAVATSVAEVVKGSDIVFLCLPSAKHARAVFEGDGILKNIRSGQVIVDLGTSSVNQTRDFARQLQASGRIVGRRADRADASGRAGRNLERHGRRVAGIVYIHRTLDPLLCH